MKTQKWQNIYDQPVNCTVRNYMTKIPTNYGKEILCLCGAKEPMMHIYNCEIWSEKEKKENFIQQHLQLKYKKIK